MSTTTRMALALSLYASCITSNHLSANVSPSEQRTAAVKAAQSLISARSAPSPLPDPTPNPFLWPVDPEPDVVEDFSLPAPVATRPNAVGIDTLRQMALQIPATGTVTISGETVLLLGQKRLKVGDSVTINFEGENHELVISNLQSSSFTVRYRGLSVSRPISYSSSSPTLNRP